MRIQHIHFQNTIHKQEHVCPIYINVNISYEGISLPVNRDEGMFIQNHFPFFVIIIYHLTFLWFLFNVVFLTTFFPSQLDLSIVQASLCWSSPLILVDTIIKGVTRLKRTLSKLRWLCHFSRSVIIIIHFKLFFVNRDETPIPTHLCVSVKASLATILTKNIICFGNW